VRLHQDIWLGRQSPLFSHLGKSDWCWRLLILFSEKNHTNCHVWNKNNFMIRSMITTDIHCEKTHLNHHQTADDSQPYAIYHIASWYGCAQLDWKLISVNRTDSDLNRFLLLKKVDLILKTGNVSQRKTIHTMEYNLLKILCATDSSPYCKGVRKGGLGLKKNLALDILQNFITCPKDINCFRILFAC